MAPITKDVLLRWATIALGFASSSLVTHGYVKVGVISDGTISGVALALVTFGISTYHAVFTKRIQLVALAKAKTSESTVRTHIEVGLLAPSVFTPANVVPGLPEGWANRP
jgi:hypothetical protein